jgi:hypothetical protein
VREVRISIRHESTLGKLMKSHVHQDLCGLKNLKKKIVME